MVNQNTVKNLKECRKQQKISGITQRFLRERRGSKRTLSRSQRCVLVMYRIVIQRDAETSLFISIRPDSCRFGLVLHKICTKSELSISALLFLGCLFNQHGHQNGIQFMSSFTSHSSVATQPNAVSLAIWSFQIPCSSSSTWKRSPHVLSPITAILSIDAYTK